MVSAVSRQVVRARLHQGKRVCAKNRKGAFRIWLLAIFGRCALEGLFAGRIKAQC